MLNRTLGTLLVSGTLVIGTAVSAQARVADSPTPTFPTFSGTVTAVVHKGTTVYVGGEFTSATDSARSVGRQHVAAFDATTGLLLPWNPKVTGAVSGLAVRKEGVYILGDFTAVRGVARQDIARVTRDGRGTVDPAFKHRTNGAVQGVTFSKRKVYFGGTFTAVDGHARSELAAVGRRGTSKLKGWSPKAAQGQVTDLIKKREGVYIAGFFHQLNGSLNHPFLALVTKKGGKTRTTFRSAPHLVLDIVSVKGRIYAGEGGHGGGGALAVERKTGHRIFERRFDGDVAAVAVMDDVVYVGGHFTQVCVDANQSDTGVCQTAGFKQRNKGASLTTAGTVSGWNPQFNTVLGVMALSTFKPKGELFAGGAFTRAGNTVAPHFAGFDPKV